MNAETTSQPGHSLRSTEATSRPVLTDAERNSTSVPQSDSRGLRIVQLAVLAVFLWMFRTLFTGQIYVTDDLLNYHYPIRQFYQNCLKSGDAFDWMPSLFSGFYLSGSGQAGTYHPLHWLLYRFLPLDMAFNLEVLASYPFMFLGMLLLLRRHVASPEAAWLGAITFTFSGFCTLHFLHPNAIAVVSHLPWLLYCIDQILKPSTRRSVLFAETGIAVLTGSQILLGYPQYVWYSVLAEMLYCLLITERRTVWFRRSVVVAVPKIVGVLLGAVQLLPSMEALRESERTAMAAEYFGLFPLSPADLIQWISPYVTKSRVFGQNTHELGAYFGAVPFLLLVFCCLRLRMFWKAQPLVRFAFVLFVISLWLSFGRSGGLYVLQSHLPLIGKFRWPSRIVVLIHFSVALLGSVALSELQRNAGIRSQLKRVIQKLWGIPILSVAVSAGVWSLVRSVPQSPLPLLIIGPVLSVLAVLMLKDLAGGKASTALVLFVLGDLVSYGFTYEALSHVQTSAEVMQELKRPPGKPESGKVLAETHGPDAVEGFGGNELVLAGYQQSDGYEGLIPQIYLPDENLSLEALQVMGVRWVVNAPVHQKISGLVTSADPYWLECPDPKPRFRLSNRVTIETDLYKAAKLVGATDSHVLPEDVLLDPTDISESERIEVLTDRPGYIELQVSSEKPRLLVMNERYSAGWAATCDYGDTKLLRANADFMALPVGTGLQRIVLTFQPAGLRTGTFISQAAVLVLLAYSLLKLLMIPRSPKMKKGL